MKLLRYEPEVPNFGDDLNDLIWPALAPTLFNASDAGLKAEAFVGIGTIIGIDPGQSRRLHVFSSGTGYSAATRWDGLDIDYHCVRGPVTARVLGLPRQKALTDGAVLTPLLGCFRKMPADERRNVVVVPHYQTIAFPGWNQAAGMAGFHLVDPRGSPQQVIAALAAARLVLTESLHGAILADAFGVPWCGFAVSQNFSTAKWTDWTASVGIAADITLLPPPDPMPLLRFGRRSEPFGTQLSLNLECAVQEFERRIASPGTVPFMKAQAKRLLEAVPAGRRLLGYHPERTAEALTRLATLSPQLSSGQVRETLRDQMLARLSNLVKQHGSAEGVLA